MSNVFNQLKELLAPGREEIALVASVSVEDGVAVLELPGGGLIRARGTAAVDTKVFVKEGVIQGPAPNLPLFVDVI